MLARHQRVTSSDPRVERGCDNGTGLLPLLVELPPRAFDGSGTFQTVESVGGNREAPGSLV
jgi:hypothetical protein